MTDSLFKPTISEHQKQISVILLVCLLSHLFQTQGRCPILFYPRWKIGSVLLYKITFAVLLLIRECSYLNHSDNYRVILQADVDF